MYLLYCRDKKLIATYESNFGQCSQQLYKESNARLQTIASKVAMQANKQYKLYETIQAPSGCWARQEAREGGKHCYCDSPTRMTFC